MDNNETIPRDERLVEIASMDNSEIEELLGLDEGDPSNAEEVAAACRGAEELSVANPDLDARDLLLAARSERIMSGIEIPNVNVAVGAEGTILGMGQTPREAAEQARNQMGL